MVCEKCWADAALLARSEGTSQTEAYYKILARHNYDSTTRIRELEAQLAVEKKRRIYYQDIVYSVCNVLDIDDRHSGNGIVCGTAEEPCSDVETRIQQLTTELDSLRQQLTAANAEIARLNAELAPLGLPAPFIAKEAADESV